MDKFLFKGQYLILKHKIFLYNNISNKSKAIFIT